MKERPIIFSGPMVHAILEDRKLQTRRVAKFVPLDPDLNLRASSLLLGDYFTGKPEMGKVLYSMCGGCWNARTQALLCPYGKPGDRLWVRETWQIIDGYPDAGDCNQTDEIHFEYLADGKKRMKRVGRPFPWPCWIGPSGIKYGVKPAIHMPRWASRILLEIEQVRAQRVQEISLEDCLAEGIEVPGRERMLAIGPISRPCDEAHCREHFRKLWDSINSKRGYGWEVNPWVWCLTFKRVSA